MVLCLFSILNIQPVKNPSARVSVTQKVMAVAFHFLKCKTRWFQRWGLLWGTNQLHSTTLTPTPTPTHTPTHTHTHTHALSFLSVYWPRALEKKHNSQFKHHFRTQLQCPCRLNTQIHI